VFRRLFLLLSVLPLAAASAAVRFPSPQGKLEVAFEARPERSYPNHNARTLPKGARAQVYSVAFYFPRTGTAALLTYFTDIQLDPAAPFPTPHQDLFKRITWSPSENFAILPREAWPDQKGRPVHRQIVSLSKVPPWEMIDFKLDDAPLIWRNEWTVLGHLTDGCRVVVALFDGRTGKISTIQGDEGPVGYRIGRRNENEIWLEPTPNSCSTSSTGAAAAIGECIVIDLRFERRRIVPCAR